MLSLLFAPSSCFLLYLSFDPVLGFLLLPCWLLPGARATPSLFTPTAQVVSGLNLHLPRTSRTTHVRLCICCVSIYATLPHACFITCASRILVSFMMVEHACWRLIPPFACVLPIYSLFLLDDRWCWLVHGMISCWWRLLAPRTWSHLRLCSVSASVDRLVWFLSVRMQVMSNRARGISSMERNGAVIWKSHFFFSPTAPYSSAWGVLTVHRFFSLPLSAFCLTSSS